MLAERPSGLREYARRRPVEPELVRGSASAAVQKGRWPYGTCHRGGPDWCILVSRNGISENCRSFLAGAELFQASDGQIYARAIHVIPYVLDDIEVTSVRSREGVAKVTYRLIWKETQGKWWAIPKINGEFKDLRGTPMPDGSVLLAEYDQGWEVRCAYPVRVCNIFTR